MGAVKCLYTRRNLWCARGKVFNDINLGFTLGDTVKKAILQCVVRHLSSLWKITSKKEGRIKDFIQNSVPESTVLESFQNDLF